MIEPGSIHYDQAQQLVLNAVLGAMVFGLALDIRPADFARVIKRPKAPAVGLLAQFALLPAATWALTMLVDLPVGIELGMILVAACPSGAISNFITYLARGSVALSISMTAVASAAAVILMPLNFAFWAGMNPGTRQMLREIDVGAFDLFVSLLVVLAIPLALGQFVLHQWPRLAGWLHRGLKHLSVLALFVFIIAAVARNLDAFLAHFGLLFACVMAHNGAALAIGYLTARSFRLDPADTRAVTIEVGIQNSSLAIAITFSQFNAEGGMLLISAFWGTWHIVSGLLVATAFRLRGMAAARAARAAAD